MFGNDSEKYSPYSPSNRHLLNTLFATPPSNVILPETNASKLIDWPNVSAAHRKIFERQFEQMDADNPAFAAFQRDGGETLKRHALFEVLSERTQLSDWRRWPEEFQDPYAASVAEVARAHARRVAFYTFMQWRASCDLLAAQDAARNAGMPIGLIGDLAVGVDPGGSECWSHPSTMLQGLTIGAPPDALGPLGQNWGLTTFSPWTLAADGFAPFLSVLRTAMRYGGGVRIDHVMGLSRLWVIPENAHAKNGAYLRYPIDDLLRLVAIESWRHRCIVIGEDLGTVASALRRNLSQRGILGMDVLPFMRDDATFVSPSRWRANAIAMTSTHDTPTTAGWWLGRDIQWQRKLGLLDLAQSRSAARERNRSRTACAKAARDANIALTAKADAASAVDAALRFAAQSPSPLLLAPFEDILGAREAPNSPGTVATHPNWRRRYNATTSQLFASAPVRKRLAILARARSHP